METAEILDVTSIDPRYKHPIIFKKFESLLPGASIIVSDDYDDNLLYYQFLAEHGQSFQWSYLQSGPSVWKIKVTKLQKEQTEPTIGELVANNYNQAPILKKWGIDHVCGGARTLKQACDELKLNTADVEKELHQVSDETQLMDFMKWDVGFICKYLIQLHHQFIKTKTPFIEELAQQAARINRTKYPEVDEIATAFGKAGALLMLNTIGEEQVLFPYIMALSDAHKKGNKLNAADFGNISVPIKLIAAEHKQALDYCDQIHQMTNNYTLPAYPTNSHSLLFKMLRDYENDLHFHLHLENNILFPKAIQLENDMRMKDLIQE